MEKFQLKTEFYGCDLFNLCGLNCNVLSEVIHLDTKTLPIEDPFEKVNHNMTAVFFMYHGERGELQYNVLRRDIFEKLFIPKKEI